MAVVALKSTAVTNANATPRVQNPAGIQNGVVKRSQGFAAIGNGDSIGSTDRIGKVRSSDSTLTASAIVSADIGTTGAADFGLYDVLTHTNGGAVVDADFFASAVSFSGGAIDSEITFEGRRLAAC